MLFLSHAYGMRIGYAIITAHGIKITYFVLRYTRFCHTPSNSIDTEVDTIYTIHVSVSYMFTSSIPLWHIVGSRTRRAITRGRLFDHRHLC